MPVQSKIAQEDKAKKFIQDMAFYRVSVASEPGGPPRQGRGAKVVMNCEEAEGGGQRGMIEMFTPGFHKISEQEVLRRIRMVAPEEDFPSEGVDFGLLTTSENGYKFTITRSMAPIPKVFSSSKSSWRPNIPPCIFGCNVLIRPDIISGCPV